MLRGLATLLLVTACTGSGTSAPPSGTPSGAGRSVVDDRPLYVDAETAELRFRSATGNIRCAFGSDNDLGYGSCQVREHTFALPSDLRCAAADVVEIGLDDNDGPGAEVRCAPFRAGDERALPYGHALEIGGLRCDSDEAGMTCTDLGTRRGFFLSRASYRVF
jgi:hypothetical protein